MKIPAITATTALLAALALTGCSSSGSTPPASEQPASSSSTSAAPHNQADVSFATDMIPHHAQAVEMANSAPSQAASPVVKSLAKQIKGAQDPEIKTMSGWLRSWGKPVPSTSMGAMQMGSGMMSDADMSALDKTSGAAYDRMWVTLMIRHHQGAITMAATERTKGSNPAAKELAGKIITAQNAEITRMRTLLKQLPASSLA
ncbi:MAG: DUF305 domain-containing protein [Allobranchiibius sp.]